METTTKMLIIAFAIVSIALVPSAVISQSADAQSKDSKPWCESQGKGDQWTWGCQAGWYDHDHCQKYYPVNSVEGYKAGWNHGHCK